jgi:hypothetical protein
VIEALTGTRFEDLAKRIRGMGDCDAATGRVSGDDAEGFAEEIE